MQTPSAVDLAQAFLDVLWADPPPNDLKLAMALDRLLAGVHDVVETEPAEGRVASPERDWKSLYGELGERFPDYGFYAVASPLAVGADSYMTGDAIDDLADITTDLREVLWLGENVGPDDAAWYFRFAYGIHWGRHARELALYLHARITRID